LLASSSNLLTISLQDKECSFSLSSDRKSLQIERVDLSRDSEKSICGVEIELTSDSNNKILTSLILPIRSPSSLVSLRIDPWLPLIFDSAETIQSGDDLAKVSSLQFTQGMTF
ncbi:hypothetical protein PFISCL1PPCAC_25602, partial [Pristionchus fissidentatus]